MNTSEVLNTAADLIEERGWKRGNDGFRGKGGLCLEGGIIAALGWEWGAVPEMAFSGYTCPAYEAVRDHLDVVRNGDNYTERLWLWNDAPTRTAAEVIEVLRACAVIEAAREEQDAVWETYAEVVTA
jgi:hypothetical protein